MISWENLESSNTNKFKVKWIPKIMTDQFCCKIKVLSIYLLIKLHDRNFPNNAKQLTTFSQKLLSLNLSKTEWDSEDRRKKIKEIERKIWNSKEKEEREIEKERNIEKEWRQLDRDRAMNI